MSSPRQSRPSKKSDPTVTPTVLDSSGTAIELENSDEHEEHSDIEWTADEEAKLVRRIDIILVPLLALGFFALQLDRGNIGYALTDDFMNDVGITQNQFNVGQQLLSVGIILLEVPSNLVLFKIGPAIWVNCQMIAWGAVATFQAFQNDLGSYLSTRLLLGLCEAGFIPASLYILGQWYKKEELSKRFSWFFLGNLLAAALTGLIAFGVLPMRGIAGLAGWQWLFIIEGIFTIMIGCVTIVLLPDSPRNPTSLLHLRFFDERQSQILVARIMESNPNKATERRNITWQEFKAFSRNWRLLPHFLMTICALAPASTFNSYAPSLVQSFGFEAIRANAMTSVGYWILLFTILIWGWFADRLQVRGVLVSIGILLGLIFYIADRSVIYSESSALKFGLLTASIAMAWPWHPINGSWLSMNTQSPSERSITMAMHVVSANCAGLIGSQVFRSDDAPHYPRGWTVIVALSATGFALSLVANLQYYISNGRRLQRTGLQWKY